MESYIFSSFITTHYKSIQMKYLGGISIQNPVRKREDKYFLIIPKIPPLSW